ncbi:MAG: site-2 protease family protein [Saprospiraceae bacterium]|nr:site-2 protease family protein [Saprospiraceae bacterium]
MKGGSFRLATISGIPVQIHWTFALVFVWMAFAAQSRSFDWIAITWSVMFVVALFSCVVLHEFGHALTARRYGVTTRDIILSPIGGVARLDRLPEQPLEEFFVAAAGPAVNILLAALFSMYFLFAGPGTLDQLLTFIQPGGNLFVMGLDPLDYFVFGLMVLNLTLAVFNLLPAFPMDGGRILRALLAVRMGRARATRLAANIGKVMAVLLLLLGIWEMSLITSLIGVFVYVTASSEYRMVQIDELLDNHPVEAVLRTDFKRLYMNDHLYMAAEELSKGLEKNFLVIDQWNEPVGTLPEREILQGVKTKKLGQPIGLFMQKGFSTLLPADTLKTALSKLQNQRGGVLPVFNKDRLIGVVDEPALSNFIELNRSEKKK